MRTGPAFLTDEPEIISIPVHLTRRKQYAWREGEIGNFVWVPGHSFYLCVGLVGFAFRFWRMKGEWGADSFRYIPSWWRYPEWGLPPWYRDGYTEKFR